MKAIITLFAGSLLLIVVVAIAAINAVAQALPLILTGLIIALVLRALSHSPSRPATARTMPPTIAPSPQWREPSGGVAAVPGPPHPSSTGAWVFLPVWVPPTRRPSPPRIDTVFLREEPHDRPW
ncbi:hypothetical protein [Mycobacterium sp. GA-2829]|uniref:hypothetical protein n=1 Tax=Mycobacterium sp. GA-2829 TaxID=1772283 RepID=UPI000AEC5CDD|nr:hypothetical protein [Mycobacterium sp. GA-2829]